VNASPRIVWATLHDPANAPALFPQLRLEPPAPDWPAAASTRRAETRVGLLRDAARVESLEARPQSSFALRVTGAGFSGEGTVKRRIISRVISCGSPARHS